MTQAEAKNILVIKLGALGDFIQALGPMAAIRKHHEGARVTLLTTKAFEGFGRDSGYFDDIWIDERPRWLNILGWQKLKALLNGGGFDRVYDLQNNDRTALYFKLFHKKPEWVGTAPGASHRNDSPQRTAGHAFEGHVQTLGLAGISNVRIDTLDWMKANISAFPLRKPYVLLIPGCSPQHPQKRWPAEKYGRLALMLHETGYQPVVIGTQAEEEASLVITKACPGALDLTAQTSLAQVTAMARSAAGAIGNDTGPMHLIAATGCPVVALFSPYSDKIRHRPRGAEVQILQTKDLNTLEAEKVLKLFKPREQPPRATATTH